MTALVAASLLGMLQDPTTDTPITVHKRTRIAFSRGQSGKTVKGFIGGEQHDVWLLKVRKGQKVTARILKGLPELSPDFGPLEKVGVGRYSGVAKETGDLVFRMYAFPESSHYAFRVEVH